MNMRRSWCYCATVYRWNAPHADQIRASTDEDETPGEPGSAEDREEATIGTRALMYFPPPLNDHYAGITESYNSSKYV